MLVKIFVKWEYVQNYIQDLKAREHISSILSMFPDIAARMAASQMHVDPSPPSLARWEVLPLLLLELLLFMLLLLLLHLLHLHL